MENKKSIKKLFLITLMMYISTLIIAVTLNSEKNLSSLKNGPLLMLLFYGQLILILINITINRKDKNISSLELKKILDVELMIKSSIFFIYNIILPNLNRRSNSLIVCSILIIAFLINISILIYSFKHINKLTINIKKEVNSKIVNTKYSLIGIILYFIAIGISSSTTYLLIFKVCLFVLSINILGNNFKKHYSIVNFRNKINLSLIIGAMINISIFIYLYFMFNELDKKTFFNMRDIAFIISALFIIPYLKKSQFSNS
ncbi:hypothetical protein [Clostridium sp. C8]|uniref:hypothetical protein n=1 Tax=Clostridium sp. C8 TaxID=1667357 RepID=UPI00062E5A8E|nr:hypothetical protein [Clostridium sp. C8]KLE16279.1 hypothetical protein AAT22_06705 [Clostridium sp. C8]